MRLFERYPNGSVVSSRKVFARNKYLAFGVFFLLLLIYLLTGIKINQITSSYSEYLTINEASRYSSGGESNFYQDANDILIGVHRVTSAVARYDLDSMSFAEMQLERLTFESKLSSLNTGGRLYTEFSKYPSFYSAHDRLTELLYVLYLYEDGAADHERVFASSKNALREWTLFTSDVSMRLSVRQDKLEHALTSSRPIAESSIYVIEILLVLWLLTLILALFAGWKLIMSDARRFKAMELLIASIGHDLRSPLQAIQSANSLLNGTLTAAERSRYSGIVVTSTNTLARLVGDIVQIASNEKLSYVRAPVNIKRWCRGFADIYKQKAASKGLQWKESIDADDNFYSLDPDRLRQCMGNLIDNAIKYTKSGGIEFRLAIKKTNENSSDGNIYNIVFDVIDSGSGIAKIDIPRIFEAFERGTNVEDRGGMGLGLSIVARVITDLGGTVSVESNIGVGSRFTVKIPTTLAEEIETKEETVAAVSSTLISQNQYSSTKKISQRFSNVYRTNEVMIIDDDDGISASMSGLLRDAGFGVECAQDGMEGLLKLASTPFAVVLTDIEMPNIDGFGVAEKCQSFKHKPFLIAMTAYTNSINKDHRSKYFDMTLLKPVSDDVLLNAIESGLASRSETMSAELWHGLSS